MPDRDESIPPPPPSSPSSDSAVSPPIIRPEEWEEEPAFRETFLLYFTDPVANATLRSFGRLLHELVLEFWRMWPPHPEGIFPAECRAVVADLRHLQGALQEWTSPATAPEHPYEVRLAGIGAEVAEALGELADRLERGLDEGRRKP
ncbi:MAG: hypothetical protein JF614_26805 [Acidobacteria bacterium]|nr:hypothetical protein [Acidobacteriota bacterium]